MEGQSFRTIAKNLTVNYRNVYYMIKSYKEHGLDGIRSKRSNAGVKDGIRSKRIPKISSELISCLGSNIAHILLIVKNE